MWKISVVLNKTHHNLIVKNKRYKMRPSEVSVDEIVNAGFKVQRSGSNVTGYKLKKIIGKGRPERLMEVWEQEMTGESKQENGDDLHVLEPEVEVLLFELLEKVGSELHAILVAVDKKIRIMADKRVELIQHNFEIEGHNFCAQIDELEEIIGCREMDIDRLKLELYSEQSKPNDQFENEKTILKLRARLQSKSDLLNERQLRINELTQMTKVLRRQQLKNIST